MKSSARHLSLLVLFAVATETSILKAGDYKPGAHDKPEKKFVVQPGGTLSFDADLAHGEVETGDFESVRVQFMSYYKVETAEEVEALESKLSIEMSQEGNTVKVTARFADENQANRDKVRLNFKVAIPRKFNLDLRTGGSARIASIDGAVKVTTLGGSLTMENVTGSLTASSSGGALSIKDVSGDLVARCSGGSTAIGRVSGQVVLHSDGGSVSVAEAGVLDATVNGGSITAFLPKTPGADCKVLTKGGGIDLRLGPAAAVTIDAAWTSGGIVSDFEIAKKVSQKGNELKGDINGGGPVVVLRTSGGAIHLNK